MSLLATCFIFVAKNMTQVILTKYKTFYYKLIFLRQNYSW